MSARAKESIGEEGARRLGFGHGGSRVTVAVTIGELTSARWCGKLRLLPGMMLLTIAVYPATDSHRVQFISWSRSSCGH